MARNIKYNILILLLLLCLKSLAAQGIRSQEMMYCNNRGTEYAFALKTNLLYDAMSVVNIEAEFPIGNRWSVGVEWMFPWWTFGDNKYSAQLLMGTIEAKYWWSTRKQRERLTGHALGVYVSSGYYDLQYKKTGYQGEIIPIAGVSYSYSHKIAKRLNVEYSLGVGVMNTKYKKYTADDNYDVFPWLQDGKTVWVGPTKLEVSLVWIIGKIKNRW